MDPTRKCMRRFILIAGLLTPPIATPSAVEAQSSPTVRRITEVWREREKSIRSVRVEFQETRTDFRHGFIDHLDPTKRWPDEDTTYRTDCVIVIEGQRSRYSTEGQVWTSAGGTQLRHLTHSEYVSVFDGTSAKTLGVTSYEGSYPNATIRKQKRNFNFDAPHSRPAMWYCRPLSPDMGGFDAESLEMTREVGVLEGATCPILGVRKPRRAGFVKKLWLDPNNFLIRRTYSYERDGSLSHQIDVTYKRDAEGRWTPTSWKNLRFLQKALAIESVCRVTTFELNRAAPDGTFQLEFPDGTWVTDLSGDSEVAYIVRANSTNRIILRSDIGATYEQLRNTEPGEARLHRDAPAR